MISRAVERVRYRCPEVYAGYWDARRTPRPALRVARRVGTVPYVIGYAVAMVASGSS